MSHIVAIGGLLAEENGPLIRYSLELTGKSRPTLGFLGTASGDAVSYRERFAEIAGALECEASVLPFFTRTPDVGAWVDAQDVILVGGGNTRSMLAVWREWALPVLLQRAWQRGTVLTGWSAGAICWFAQGVTDSHADRLEALDCLEFLSGSCCPHYSAEADRRGAFHKLIAEGRISGGIAIDDGAAVHFVDQQPCATIGLASDVHAYDVDLRGDQIQETAIAVNHFVVGSRK